MYTSIHLAGPISAYPNGTRAWHRSPKFSQCTNTCISICFGLHYCEAETRISLEIAAVCFSLKYDFVVTSCSSYVCVTLFLSHPKYLHRFFFFFFGSGCILPSAANQEIPRSCGHCTLAYQQKQNSCFKLIIAYVLAYFYRNTIHSLCCDLRIEN